MCCNTVIQDFGRDAEMIIELIAIDDIGDGDILYNIDR
ncbi:MAG: hypothetical protein ACI90V_008135 [Bacillariaceae sp.]|jgi:hypothetical protein